MGAETEQLEFYIEANPAGGYRVMLRGHAVPVSRHDTEEEAVARMAAYERGAVTAAMLAVADPPAG
jgi:hypothetical protein